MRTDGGDEVDDDEGIEDRDNGRCDGSHDVAQALETPEEAQDPEGPQHLERAVHPESAPKAAVLYSWLLHSHQWRATCVLYPKCLDRNIDRTQRHERQGHNDKIEHVPA